MDKAKLLELLVYIDKVCRENNIRYFISSGTLLGAVRHKGFIPWDDDADIVMPREDYNKYLKLFTKYTLKTVEDKDHWYSWARLYYSEKDAKAHYKGTSIFVDIFPLDNMPDDYDEALKHFHKARQCDAQAACYKAFGKWDKMHEWYIKTDKLYQAYGPTNHVGFWVTDKFKRVYDNKSDWEPIELEFEGHLFKAPKGWHNILTNEYGNYMVPKL